MMANEVNQRQKQPRLLSKLPSPARVRPQTMPGPSSYIAPLSRSAFVVYARTTTAKNDLARPSDHPATLPPVLNNLTRDKPAAYYRTQPTTQPAAPAICKLPTPPATHPALPPPA